MKDRLSVFFSFVLIASIIVIGFIFKINQSAKIPSGSLASNQLVRVGIKDKYIIARVANTEASRAKGLSDTEPLAPDTGMLFVFSKPDIYGFWMKDMKYSIDIIWVNSDQKIIHIENSLLPDTYPKVFKSEQSAIYVVEVPAGFAVKNNITVGDNISIGN